MTHGELYVYRRKNIDFSKSIDDIAKFVSVLPSRMQRNVAMMYYKQKLQKCWGKNDSIRKIQIRPYSVGSVSHSDRIGISETIQTGNGGGIRASNNSTEEGCTQNISEFGKPYKSGERDQRDTGKDEAEAEGEKRSYSEETSIGGGDKRWKATSGTEILSRESGCYQRETSGETQAESRAIQSTGGEAEIYRYVNNDSGRSEGTPKNAATHHSGEMEGEKQREGTFEKSGLQTNGRLQTAGSGESERETSDEERSAFISADDYYDYYELKRIFEKHEIRH